MNTSHPTTFATFCRLSQAPIGLGHVRLSVDTPALDEYDVFIIAGQSNAQGYLGTGDYFTNTTLGYAPPGLNEAIQPLDASTVFYYDEDAAGIVDASVTPSPVPSNADVQGGMSLDWWGYRGGPAPAFGHAYNAATGKKVIVVYFAVGGSGIVSGTTYSGGNWLSSSAQNTTATGSSTAYADQMAAKWAAFKAMAATAELDYAFKGIIWCQGESEQAALAAETMTTATLVGHIGTIFDRFVTDYAADLAPGSTLINVISAGINSGDGGESITIERIADMWSFREIRKAQIQAADSHASARMVYPAIERFFLDGTYPNNFWSNGFRGGTQSNSVHWDQSQYNEVGAFIAAEMTGTTQFITPTAPSGLALTVDGPWRIKLAWNTIPTDAGAELRELNIYRRVSGGTDWTTVFTESNVPSYLAAGIPVGVALWDEHSLLPGTTYEYRLGHRNEFAESYSSIVSATTATIAADPVAAYVTAVSPADSTTIQNIYDDLASGDHLVGLRSLYLLQDDLQGASDTAVYNLMRTGTGADRYDLTALGIEREAGFYAFTGYARLESGVNGLLPSVGPYSYMMGFKTEARKNAIANSATRFLTQNTGTSADGLAIGLDTRFEQEWTLNRFNLQQAGGPPNSGTSSVAADTLYTPCFVTSEIGETFCHHGASAGARHSYNGNYRRPWLSRKIVPAVIANVNQTYNSSNIFCTSVIPSATDRTANTITSTAHPFATEDEVCVKVSNQGTTGISAFPTRYYIISVDANTFKLAISAANAAAGIAIDFDNAATGISVTEVVRLDHRMRIPFVAVWNRGLTGAEYVAVRAIFNNRLGLGL